MVRPMLIQAGHPSEQPHLQGENDSEGKLKATKQAQPCQLTREQERGGLALGDSCSRDEKCLDGRKEKRGRGTRAHSDELPPQGKPRKPLG